MTGQVNDIVFLMKRRTLLLLILLVTGLMVVKFVFFKPPADDKPKGQGMKGQPVNVTGFVVHPRVLDNKVFATGTIRANEEVELHPEVAGKLVSLPFREGAAVKKGSLLAKINDIDLKAQLHKTTLQWQLAKERAARLKGLLDIQGVSREEYDAAASQVETLGADIDYIRAQIAKTEITAPFSGIVGLRRVSEGSYVTPASVIASMQQLDQLKIDFTVPEKYAHILSMGDAIHFTVGSDTTIHVAKILAIEPAIDQQTRQLAVRATCFNHGRKLLPGAFAKIELVSSREMKALMIPSEAIIPELKGKKVFVCRQGMAMPQKVETGVRNDKQIEITQGLSEGDTVITTGIMALKPETRVNIINFSQ